MAYDLPPDLTQLRRDFLAAEERLREIGASLPAPSAIAAQEAELSDDQRAQWDAAQGEAQRLAGEIHRHPWWGDVDNRQSAATALDDAAKS